MVDVELRGSAHRIKKCACDLLSIGGDLVDDDDSWDLMGNDLRLKSTFLYCDFNRMISSAPRDQKKPLTELANKLFCSIETFINLYIFINCYDKICFPVDIHQQNGNGLDAVQMLILSLIPHIRYKPLP
ncbi:hypothetical protein SO802_007704 [Lithocarpus litseifolius]|uniref:Uncharacterized protein n=1 Tax=Lithocarpus litseifolius TaxID=425828 RepID=A0AAW2DQA3_9ROSI